MAKTIENLFRILHYSSDILVILIYLLLYSKIKREKSLLIITIYIFLDLILNLFNRYFTPNWGLYIWSTFTFVEYSIFSYIIWSNIKQILVRKIIFYCSLIFIVFTTVYNILTNFKSIDSIPIGIETILILLYSFYYLYEQTNDTSNLFIYSKYQFWIIIGFMIYLAGSFFVFIYASKMERDLLSQYWFLTNGFYACMNILFAISFFVFVKKPKNNFPHKLHPYLN